MVWEVGGAWREEEGPMPSVAGPATESPTPATTQASLGITMMTILMLIMTMMRMLLKKMTMMKMLLRMMTTHLPPSASLVTVQPLATAVEVMEEEEASWGSALVRSNLGVGRRRGGGRRGGGRGEGGGGGGGGEG